MSKVFISYSRKDREFGEKLHLYLAGRNHDVWRDEEDIPPTSKMWEEIEQAIRNTDNFVFIMSPGSIASASCHHEFSVARTFPKRVVPILLIQFNEREALIDLTNTPLTNFQESLFKNRDLLLIGRENLTLLGSIDWISFEKANEFDQQFEKLDQALNTDLDYVKLHTRYLVGADEWEKDAYNPKRLLRAKERIVARGLLRYPANIKPEITDTLRKFITQSRCAEIEEWRETKRKKNLIRSLEKATQRHKRWLAIAILGIAIFAVLAVVASAEAQRAYRFKVMADASYDRSVGSNLYLIKDFPGAKQSYEKAFNRLKALETVTDNDWSQFATDEYKNNNIHIDDWLKSFGMSCAQLDVPDLQCAADNLQAALKLNPSNTDASLALTDVYRVQGKLIEAKATYENIIKYAGGDPDFLAKAYFVNIMKAKLDYSDKQYSTAVGVFTYWINLFEPTPGDTDAGIMSSYYLDMLYYRALSFVGQNDSTNACTDWKTFESTLSKFPPALKVLWFNKELKEAANAVKKCP